MEEEREQQIKDLARYLGCKRVIEYSGKDMIQEFEYYMLDDLEFKLLLKPLSSLTQEDYTKMINNPGLTTSASLWLKKVDEGIYVISWRYADWLRNHSYYLGEESIKEFVKLEE